MTSKCGLTRKQRAFVEAIERNTAGLTAVSTGVCHGCEQCRDEHGQKITCPTCNGEGWIDEDNDCQDCDGDGKRQLTMEEFEEEWSHGRVDAEPSFSWSGCDICGSSLGGNMEPWHGVDENGEIVHGDNACVDCVMYLANGDLPE